MATKSERSAPLTEALSGERVEISSMRAPRWSPSLEPTCGLIATHPISWEGEGVGVVGKVGDGIGVELGVAVGVGVKVGPSRVKVEVAEALGDGVNVGLGVGVCVQSGVSDPGVEVGVYVPSGVSVPGVEVDVGVGVGAVAVMHASATFVAVGAKA